MRQVLIGDIIAVARSVLGLPHTDRATAIAAILENAHIADKVTKRTGRPHRAWGNGSLIAASTPKHGRAEPFAGDMDYLDALKETIEQVLCWKRQKRGTHRRHKT